MLVNYDYPLLQKLGYFTIMSQPIQVDFFGFGPIIYLFNNLKPTFKDLEDSLKELKWFTFVVSRLSSVVHNRYSKLLAEICMGLDTTCCYVFIAGSVC